MTPTSLANAYTPKTSIRGKKAEQHERWAIGKKQSTTYREVKLDMEGKTKGQLKDKQYLNLGWGGVVTPKATSTTTNSAPHC